MHAAGTEVTKTGEHLSLLHLPARSFFIDPLKSVFSLKNGFLSVQFPSSKKVLCEFNLLQWKVLWLSAACAFCQSVRMYTQAV